jgi:beta-glucosidase
MNMLRLAFLAVLSSPLLLAQSDETPESRAASLVSRMTLEEKVLQMQNTAPAIPHLNIPGYDWWNEALHGVARAGLATVFPQAIGLAATWDTGLEQRIAETISTEARAKYNDAIRHDIRSRYRGLTFWSPNINIFRDPRWGRGQETFGEDPFLTAEMAIAFVKGMQGSDPKYFKTIATAKHFAVHSGPEKTRHSFNADVHESDLDSTYLYAFRRTLEEGGADSVMCAYNSVDGVPACANQMLLQRNLREQWRFGGYVVSDCGAVDDILHGHRYAHSMPEAAAMAVKAGTDLTCGTEYSTLVEAVKKGLISEKEIDAAVQRLFVARIRLGMFDAPEKVPFSRIGVDQIASPEHTKVALEAAEKSIVLLENTKRVLPLEAVPNRIAVVGPGADDPNVMLGNYNGTPRHVVTPYEGLRDRLRGRSIVRFALGSVYATSSTALVPPSAFKNGVTAEYFNNETLAGRPALTRPEPRVYFYRESSDPAVGKALPTPSFSARWTGPISVESSGEYQLGFGRQECDSCAGSNSIRIFLDDRPLVSETGSAAHGNQAKTAPVFLESGKSYNLRVEYIQHAAGSGVECVWRPPADSLLHEAVTAAKEADLTVAVIGLNSRLEGEELDLAIPGFDRGDRTSLDIPAPQQKLLEALLDTGKPVVVVLVNGSALAVQTARDRAAAILESWYGGQEAGTAIVNTLLGDNNPAGRLPVTFYQSVDQLPPFADYAMKGRTYRYFTGKPLYPFGYGLSYSTFSYTPAKVEGEKAIATVTNTSNRDGDEVVQLYVKGMSPNPQLRGFQRVHLKAHESRTVSFALRDAGAQSKISIGGGQPVQ